MATIAGTANGGADTIAGNAIGADTVDADVNVTGVDSADAEGVGVDDKGADGAGCDGEIAASPHMIVLLLAVLFSNTIRRSISLIANR